MMYKDYQRQKCPHENTISIFIQGDETKKTQVSKTIEDLLIENKPYLRFIIQQEATLSIPVGIAVKE